MSPLDTALDLADRGIPVFAMTVNKIPVTPHGLLDATADPVVIREIFQRPGAALLAVPTGAASGIVAIDGDVTAHGDGTATLREWTRAGRLSKTRTHRTRRGGVHLLFQNDPAHRLRSTAGRLAPNLDTRGDGGALIWWPAADLPVLYDLPLDGLPILPAWVADAAAPPPPPPRSASTPLPSRNLSRYAEAALRRAVERVAAAPEGQRNWTLNREAFALMRLSATGALAPTEIADALAIAAHHAGLPAREIAGTLASALRAGG